MTTIISRVYADEATAQAAANKLAIKGIPRNSCHIITHGDAAETLMERAQVHASAMKSYSKLLAAGNAVLVVQATFKPLGAASLTREILSKTDPIDAGKLTDDFKVSWQPDKSPSIMKDHPHMLSIKGMQPRGTITSAFGMPMLKKHNAKRSVSTGKRMSRMFWPMKLVSKKARSSSVIKGGRQMSKMFWPTRLLSTGPRRKSIIPGGGTPLSRRIGIRTVS
jgi:hypothetical protein